MNQRFGSSIQSFGGFRVPVTLTAMMRFDIGPTRERQLLTQQLDRGRTTQGTKMPEPFLKAIFGNGGIANPMATILRQQDTLKLTSVQADSIAVLNRIYAIKNDSIWTPVAKYLAGLPDQYDQSVAYERYIAARRASVDLLTSMVPDVKNLLTEEQRRKLPAFVASYLEPRYLASIRSGTATFTGSSAHSAAQFHLAAARERSALAAAAAQLQSFGSRSITIVSSSSIIESNMRVKYSAALVLIAVTASLQARSSVPQSDNSAPSPENPPSRSAA